MSPALDVAFGESPNSAAPSLRHAAPTGAMTAARELGVQYRAHCGEWRWPPSTTGTYKSADDLRQSGVCPGCLAAVVEARRRA